MEENIVSEKIKELIKKYNLDLEKLKQEQIKLAKGLEINDKIDFKLADRFGAIDNTFFNNRLLCCIIVCNKEYEIIDRAYVYEKVKFPYIPGFRNYRELVPMINVFEKLNEKPDFIFVPGQGIAHQRLGLASHFGISINLPTIGVSNSVVECNIDGEDILRNGKRIGKVLLSKEGSNPLFISPGHLISINTAYELSKKMVVPPHKRPEPLHIASKYSKEVRKEVVSE
ncbi:MAG: endonuclease V [Nanoarchaeota archaeon]|nr:endonuclease V [Nanoarchaeota archaeon]